MEGSLIGVVFFLDAFLAAATAVFCLLSGIIFVVRAKEFGFSI